MSSSPGDTGNGYNGSFHIEQLEQILWQETHFERFSPPTPSLNLPPIWPLPTLVSFFLLSSKGLWVHLKLMTLWNVYLFILHLFTFGSIYLLFVRFVDAFGHDDKITIRNDSSLFLGRTLVLTSSTMCWRKCVYPFLFKFPPLDGGIQLYFFFFLQNCKIWLIFICCCTNSFFLFIGTFWASKIEPEKVGNVKRAFNRVIRVLVARWHVHTLVGMLAYVVRCRCDL